MSKRDGVVWHELAEDAGDLPAVGAQVAARLTGPSAIRMMRTHTALHLLCGLIFRDYGAQVTGGQMYADRARMDFTLATMTQDFRARHRAQRQRGHRGGSSDQGV